MLGPDEVLVASINGVFGVKGEVRLFLHDRQSRTLSKPVKVTMISPDGERRIVGISVRSGAGKRIIAKIDGIESPEVAHTYIGWNIVVRRESLPPTAPGEFYIHDMLDLPVFEDDGVQLGKLDDVVSGERDVWVVTGLDGGEWYVLSSPENIVSVDLAGGRIVLRKGAAQRAE